MPFVRYARDRRGYETLYVMHAFEGAEKSRVRVLYACRTVPHAKVGRNSLDEGVQRRIELAYPSLKFDWPRLLKEAAASAPRPERIDPRTGEPRGAQRRERKGRPASGARGQGGPPAAKGPRPFERGGRSEGGASRSEAGGGRREASEARLDISSEAGGLGAETAGPRGDEPFEIEDAVGGAEQPADTSWAERFEPEEGAEAPEAADALEELDAVEQFEPPKRFEVPEQLEAAQRETTAPQPEPPARQPDATAPHPEEDEPQGPIPSGPSEIGSLTVDRSWPIVAIVGPDRALVLRGRYIELAHRVLSRVSSPTERIRLMREATRLNPESWRTEAQARAALAGLEASYARLAEQLRQQPPA